jgi:Zn-dependent protease
MSARFRLFRLFGIDVYLHWSWFLLVAYRIQARGQYYTSSSWAAAEVLSLFLIVLIHEFGHSLACRQVGGVANNIILWPFGGIAFGNPPPRPGAVLWTIAAGPLVNVVLVPVFGLLSFLSSSSGWEETAPNADHLIGNLWLVNLVLLIFNMLPIYPLDGGQILRALLWFKLGMARSLLVATSIGLAGGLLLAGFAFWSTSFWLGFIALFLLSQCWRGFQEAKILSRLPSAGQP